MKKIIFLTLALILAFGLILWVKGKDMYEIKTEIDIAAPPQEVWNVLVELDRWKDWNPSVKTVVGTAAMGSELDVTMCSKEGKSGKDGPRYSPVVKELVEPHFFRWRAKMMAGIMMTNDKVFELQPTDLGTKLVHKELFGGIMAVMMKSKMESSVPPMLNSQNQALKELVEKKSK